MAIARPEGMFQASEREPGHYRAEGPSASVRFDFDPAPHARYLVLPGFDADQDVVICWCDDAGRWRSGQSIRWLKSKQPHDAAVVDLDSLIHEPDYPLSRIAIQFTGPGKVVLAGMPRLFR